MSLKVKYLLLITWLLSVLSHSCNINNTKPKCDLFVIEFGVNYKSILSSGFKKVPEDVIILLKDTNGTSCYFQFDDNKNLPLYKYWKVKLKSTSWEEVKNFISKFNVVNTTIPNSDKYFEAVCYKNNLKFTCSIMSDSTLLIMYDYSGSRLNGTTSP
jgi:hypothetical protein